MTHREAAARLLEMDRVLILTHVRPDGDTVGCAAALCAALRKLGKTACLYPNPGITKTYESYAAPYWASEDFAYDYVVAVDIATLGMLPENAQHFEGKIDLSIDHHPSNSFYAKENLVVPTAAAAGEIMYEVLREMTEITVEIALPLYVAISTDTGCFIYSNTTANTHRVAAELMDTGFNATAVNKVLFRTKSKNRLAMEAQMAANMRLYDNDRIVVMEIPLSMVESLQATQADVEELSSLAALVEGTDCGVTIRELAPGKSKISLRTGGRINASDACAMLGGGGHARAAGCTVECGMEEAREKILGAIAALGGEFAR